MEDNEIYQTCQKNKHCDIQHVKLPEQRIKWLESTTSKVDFILVPISVTISVLQWTEYAACCTTIRIHKQQYNA